MSSNFSEWVVTYGITPCPLVHAGAHYAEERFAYRELMFSPVFWIEAIPDVAAVCADNLANFSDNHLITALIADEEDRELTMFIAGAEASSSSLLMPYLISASHPEVEVSKEIKLKSTKLDSLYLSGGFGDHKNYGLILDLQGAEIRAISGGVEFLSHVSFIVAEVSIRELYKSGAEFNELTKLLQGFDFQLVASDVNKTTGWGEALYLKKSLTLSNRFPKITNSFVWEGDFSFGTTLRGILIRLRVPQRIVNFFRRR